MFDSQYTKDQQAFLQQRAQQMLVQWCDAVMRSGDTKSTLKLDENDPYVQYAAGRKSPWIKNRGEGHFFIVGAGWKAASSFLKR